MSYTFSWHILKAGLDPGLWTLDSGLWTLDSGLWTLDSGLWTLSPPRKYLYISPKKTSPPKKKQQNKIPSPKYKIQLHRIFFLINKLEVCEFSNKQLNPPHPPPRKNFMSPPKNCPFPKNFIWPAEKVFFFLLINN